MKIIFSTVERTNLGFPSEWRCKSEDGKDLKISYRYGVAKISYDNKLLLTLSIDQFDTGGYMDDETLESLLIKNGLLS